ncbi:MAG: zinc ribbon domain-containing protein [Methanomassiliicoccales archaeon]|nr:zinc ribbon domain-containing protein [Methanomassiliicoccales archaeon]
MAKTFTGSILILVLLLIFCFPIGLIYLVIKWQEPSGPVNFGAPAQPYQQPPQQYQQNTGFCQKCGAALEPGAQFCQKCGNRQQ